MTISRTIYENLCEKRKARPHQKSKNIHRHHIIPKHSGGTDDNSNITYLTIREHKIAHYLLWRIHKNPNDLRSYHMLGGNLTSAMRKEIGRWCFENKIGMFHSDNQVNKRDWILKGIEKQMKEKIGIFDETKLSYYASLGGKASVKKNKTFQYWFSKEGRKERASRGAKSHKGKRAMYNPTSKTKTFHRVPPEKWEEFLSKGFIFGSPIKSNLGNKMVSKRKRKVTDGTTVYESVTAAAKANRVTSGAIIHRIKSGHGSWSYLFDT